MDPSQEESVANSAACASMSASEKPVGVMARQKTLLIFGYPWYYIPLAYGVYYVAKSNKWI